MHVYYVQNFKDVPGSLKLYIQHLNTFMLNSEINAY